MALGAVFFENRQDFMSKVKGVLAIGNIRVHAQEYRNYAWCP
jgi:hypothetical protein